MNGQQSESHDTGHSNWGEDPGWFVVFPRTQPFRLLEWRLDVHCVRIMTMTANAAPNLVDARRYAMNNMAPILKPRLVTRHADAFSDEKGS
jgi:hypothetical protein